MLADENHFNFTPRIRVTFLLGASPPTLQLLDDGNRNDHTILHDFDFRLLAGFEQRTFSTFTVGFCRTNLFQTIGVYTFGSTYE